MIRKLAIGQSIACKIKINAEQVLTITHYYLMERVIKYRHARALTLSILQRTIFRIVILVIFGGGIRLAADVRFIPFYRKSEKQKYLNCYDYYRR